MSHRMPVSLNLSTLFEPPIPPQRVLEFAIEVSGSPEMGEAWFRRPNGLLGDLSPEQVTLEGRGREALGILCNIAGI